MFYNLLLNVLKCLKGKNKAATAYIYNCIIMKQFGAYHFDCVKATVCHEYIFYHTYINVVKCLLISNINIEL